MDQQLDQEGVRAVTVLSEELKAVVENLAGLRRFRTT
jgi:hypothetical protein